MGAVPRLNRANRELLPGAALLAILLLTEAAMGWGTLSITVTGNWTVNITQANLAGGAGSDLTDTYTSATDQVSITLTTQKKNDPWTVSVNMTTASWHPTLTLWARRTANGTGAGTISGGTTYIQLTSTDQTFFTGTMDRTNVRVEYQLRNVSLTVPQGTYTTTVTYTITTP